MARGHANNLHSNNFKMVSNHKQLDVNQADDIGKEICMWLVKKNTDLSNTPIQELKLYLSEQKEKRVTPPGVTHSRASTYWTYTFIADTAYYV
jgi:hypothetical protein